MDGQANGEMVGPPGNVNGNVSGAMEEAVRVMLKMMNLKDRVRMSECTKQFRLLEQDTPKTFALVRDIRTTERELAFDVDVQFGNSAERKTLSRDVFIKMLKGSNVFVSSFKCGDRSPTLIQDMLEEMSRAELKNIKIEDLTWSWWFEDEHEEDVGKLLQFINPSVLRCIRLNGWLTQNILDKIVLTDQWKMCSAVELDAHQSIQLDFEEIAKKFNDFKLHVPELSIENCLTVIESFLNKRRERLSQFVINTPQGGVDLGIVKKLNCTLKDDFMAKSLPLKYDSPHVLELFIYHQGVRGVICTREASQEEFGNVYIKRKHSYGRLWHHVEDPNDIPPSLKYLHVTFPPFDPIRRFKPKPAEPINFPPSK